jgi:hypothetical protein
MAQGWPYASERGIKGLQVPVQKVRCINRSAAALAQGDLSAFDLALTSAAANHTVGDDLSGFVSTMAPAAEHLLGGWFVVCFSDVSGNTTAAITALTGEYIGVIRGIVQANVDGADQLALAEWLVPQTANPILSSNSGIVGATALGQKLIAKALEQDTDGTEALLSVLFNGIEGFGSNYDPIA